MAARSDRLAGSPDPIEMYDELTPLGVPDWEIARRCGMSYSAFEKALRRGKRPTSPLLVTLVKESFT